MYRSSPLQVLDMCKVCTEADRFEQNPAAGQIFRNRPAGQIFRNRPAGQMFRNRPAGQIFRNRPAGQILRNRPAGQITPNRPAGQIAPNRPAGQITLNRPAGQTGWLAGIKIVNEIRVQCKFNSGNSNKKTTCWEKNNKGRYQKKLPRGIFVRGPGSMVFFFIKEFLLGGWAPHEQQHSAALKTSPKCQVKRICF